MVSALTYKRQDIVYQSLADYIISVVLQNRKDNMIKIQDETLSSNYIEEFDIQKKGYSAVVALNDFILQIPDEFSEAIALLIQKSGLKVTTICECTGLDYANLSRWRKKKGHKVTYKNLIKFCLALHLPPEISEILFRQQRVQLNNSIEDKILARLLNQYYNLSIEEFSEICFNAGIQLFE